eukprot:TRINITY_DN62350_c0_g1_i1.p1 TRINITY_DN62350_c0_g1~~TRINITY_DN62350_c0_g1_i1.p1  ORF type:complete len:465 (-),score=54.11 TRINITY_DN62350_c0_g1_i1:511-1905(-)
MSKAAGKGQKGPPPPKGGIRPPKLCAQPYKGMKRPLDPLPGISDFAASQLRPTVTRVRQRDGTILEEKRSSGSCHGFERSVIGTDSSLPEYQADQAEGRSHLEPKAFNAAANRWLPLRDKQQATDCDPVRSGDNMGPREECSGSDLRVVTYNVWFSKDRQQERAEAMFKILEEEAADVICLQEVTQVFLSWLKEQAWVRDRYALSDAVGTTLRGSALEYGVIMLFRRGLQVSSLYLYQLPTLMSRSALVANVVVKSRVVGISTVHLESLENSATRCKQLRRILDVLCGVGPLALLAGDMNFADNAQEEAVVENAGFQDCWWWSDFKHPIGSGATMPICDVTGKPTRIDRVFARAGTPGAAAMVPSAIRRIGLEPMADADSNNVITADSVAEGGQPLQPQGPYADAEMSDATDEDMPELTALDQTVAADVSALWSRKPAVRWPSDHYGLVCDFVIADQSSGASAA